MAIPYLCTDVCQLIYEYLDPASQAMMALSCKRFYQTLGVPRETQGPGLAIYATKYQYQFLLEWIVNMGYPMYSRFGEGLDERWRIRMFTNRDKRRQWGQWNRRPTYLNYPT
jgi:hypothetical protein